MRPPHVLALACSLLLVACASLSPPPARNEPLFARVAAGMTQAQVREILGTPDEVAPSHADSTAWDYRFTDTWGYFAVFSVTFDASGRAVSKLAARTNDGGDHQ